MFSCSKTSLQLHKNVVSKFQNSNKGRFDSPASRVSAAGGVNGQSRTIYPTLSDINGYLSTYPTAQGFHALQVVRAEGQAGAREKKNLQF